MNWCAYQKPTSLQAVLRILTETGGKGRVVAGGTDLILKIKRGQCQAEVLVDITAIEEIQHIYEQDGWIHIGAAVTHAEVARNPFIRQEAMALSEGCRNVGSPQIRNVATLVGNVISAQPAGDGAVPLMALEAELRVLSEEGERWVPMVGAYEGVGLSVVDATKEVATEVRFKKLGDHSETEFFRMAKRKALALPILNGTVALVLSSDMSKIEKARIAMGPVGEKPFRARGAESYLESNRISPRDIREAARRASEEAEPRTSLRGSAFYRKEMIRVNLIRVIESILDELTRGKKIS